MPLCIFLAGLLAAVLSLRNGHPYGYAICMAVAVVGLLLERASQNKAKRK